MQRPLNSASPLHPRNGAPKRTADVATVPGQKRQTTGDLHPYLHGQTQDDSAPDKAGHSGTNVPIHSGMTDRQKAALHPIADSGSEILTEAANLGRKA
jgi:hypothetical protein